MTASPPRRFPAWARILLYLLACAVTAVFGSIVASVCLAVQYGEGWEEHLEQESGALGMATIVVAYPLVVLVNVVFVRLLDGRRFSSIGLSGPWQRHLGLGAAIGIGMPTASLVLYWAAGWLRVEPVPTVPVVGLVFATLFVYPLVGFTEELVFRGYLMTALEEWKGRGLAIAATSILFWLVHVGHAAGSPTSPSLVNEFIGVPFFLATGVMFALCRYGAGTLWLPIGLHAAFDWSVTTLFGDPGLGFPAILRAQPTVPHWLVGPAGQAGLADLGATLLLLATIYLFLYRPSQGEPYEGRGPR